MRYGHRPLVNPATRHADADYGTSEAERLAARHQHAILTRLAHAAANGRVEEALQEADRLRGVHEVIQAHHRDRARRQAAIDSWNARPSVDVVDEAVARIEAQGATV